MRKLGKSGKWKVESGTNLFTHHSSLITHHSPLFTRHFLLFTLYFLLSMAFATTYKTLTLEDLVNQTEIAFYGKVTNVAVIERDKEPWTQVSFTVTDALLGTESDASINLTFYGGTLDSGLSLTVNLMPQFFNDEEILVLAYKDDFYSPIVGFRQGLWRNSAQGFKDETGRILSLVDGKLLLDGTGGGSEDILRTLKDMLEKRTTQ
jgi:hypothetical protein